MNIFFLFPGEMNAIPIHNSKMKLYTRISDSRMVIEYSIIDELVNTKNTEIASDASNKLGLNHLYLANIMHPTDESH